MGWESARKSKPKGVVAGAYVPPVEPVAAVIAPEPDVDPLQAEDYATIERYAKALRELWLEDSRFASNWFTWTKWPIATQWWWICHIEQQAAKGENTIGAHVVTRVAMNRLD